MGKKFKMISDIDEIWNRTKGLLSDDEIKQIEAASRAPASKPFVGAPYEVEGISVQPISETVGNTVRPIEYPEGYNQKLDTSGIVKDNYNSSIEGREEVKREASDVYNEAKKAQREYKIGFDEALGRLRKVGSSTYSNPDLDSKIERAGRNYDDYQLPEQDIYSQLILSIAPALFGAFGGEDAALSAPKSGDRARSIYKDFRNEQLSVAKSNKEALLNRYEQLSKLRDAGSKAFTEERSSELDKIRTELQMYDTAMKSGQLEKLKGLDKYDSIDKERADAVQRGSEKIMDNENLPMIEAGKNKRDQSNSMANRVTDGERKASATLATLKKSGQAFDRISGKDGLNPPSMKSELFGVAQTLLGGRMTVGEFVNNFIKDPQKRAQIQAESNWIGAKLRNESGAAIGMSEYLAEANIYFPRMNDSKETILEKAAARKQVEENYKYLSGRAPEVPIVPTIGIDGKLKEEAPKEKQASPALSYRQRLEIAYNGGKGTLSKDKYERGLLEAARQEKAGK